MNAFYVESGWRTGIVLAKNPIHAIKVAVDTNLHKAGDPIVCLKIEKSLLSNEVLDLVKKGPGRLFLPSFFRTQALLITTYELD